MAGKRYPWGDEGATAEKANYGRNVGKPAVVGSYPANGYGLYDMAGSVWEWCSDRYGSDYYSKSPSRNPQGPSSGSQGPLVLSRVLRGGSWDGNANGLRVAYRNLFNPANTDYLFGFRCVSGF